MKTYTLKVTKHGVTGPDGSDLGMGEDGIFWMEVKTYDENGNWVGTEIRSTDTEAVLNDPYTSRDASWGWECSLGFGIVSCIFSGCSDYRQVENICENLWNNAKKGIYELKVAVGGDIVS